MNSCAAQAVDGANNVRVRALLDELVFFSLGCGALWIITVFATLISWTSTGPSWIFPTLAGCCTLWFIMQVGRATRAVLSAL